MYSYFINREIKIDSERGGETIDLLFMVLLFLITSQVPLRLILHEHL